MRIHLAADHAGFQMKEDIKSFLVASGFEVEDHGAESFVPDDDYPEIIAHAAKALALSDEDRAILFGASGQGEAIVANRFPRVRAAVFYGNTGTQVDTGGMTLGLLESTRAHNDANVLSIGARFVTLDEAKEAVSLWLKTPFSGEERHQRRVVDIERLVSGS
mgnify:CR=1 FL=1